MRVAFLAIALAVPAIFRAQDTSAARIIIHRSVQANDADWKAQTGYSFRRSDVEGSERQTFEVTMLEGSPYERLLALNDKPLPPEQQRQEQEKFEHEVHDRRRETPRQRHSRIANMRTTAPTRTFSCANWSRRLHFV